MDHCLASSILPQFDSRVLLQVHAENGDGVLRAQEKTFEAGITGPEGHYISRPDFLEVLLYNSPPKFVCSNAQSVPTSMATLQRRWPVEHP